MKKRLVQFASCSLALLMLLAGCAQKPNNDNNAEQNDSQSNTEQAAPDEALAAMSNADLLAQLDTDAKSEVATMQLELTADDIEGFLGVKPDTFTADIDSATVSQAAIGSIAHMTAIVKCKDAEAAARVQAEILDGFNYYRWVCVTPETAQVVTCGSYVFFLATSSDYAEQYLNAFTALAGDGNLGTVETVSEQNTGSQAMVDDNWVG